MRIVTLKVKIADDVYIPALASAMKGYFPGVSSVEVIDEESIPKRPRMGNQYDIPKCEVCGSFMSKSGCRKCKLKERKK